MTHGLSVNGETHMKERPILYSAPMVRAKLAGVKTQTRRLVKPQPNEAWSKEPVFIDRDGHWNSGGCRSDLKCPYGKVGNRLYGKESHRYHGFTEDGEPQIEYAADGAIRLCKVPSESQDRVHDIWAKLSEPGNFNVHNRACDIAWRPSIHMPRWASRILDEIVEVRVERVQNIGKDGRKAHDVLAEGITREQVDHYQKFFHADDSPALAYADLWNKINGAGSWESNPWVWVIVTKAVKA